MRGRRILRLALAVFAIGFAVWLALLLRGRSRAPDTAADPRTDPNAIVESSGGLLTRTRGEAKDFDIQHKGLRTYPDGRTVFQAVTVTVPARDDRRGFTLAGDEAEVTKDNAHVRFTGNLTLRTTDDLTMTGPEATYDSADGVVRVPGAVRFTRGRMQGGSTGATYDNTRDVLWLVEQAAIDIAADAAGQGATRMRAGSAGFARADRYIRLQDAASVTRDGQTLTGDSVTVFLQATEDVMELVELRGSSSVALPAPQPLQTLAASDINLVYADDGRTLRQAVLAESASVQFRGQGGAGGRRLGAQLIDLQLDADGTTMTALNAQEAVELSMPQAGQTPARVIAGTTLTGHGGSDRGLVGATFAGPVTFRETRPASRGVAALDRTITSDTLELATKGALDSIDRATFQGAVVVKDRQRTASAPRMIYRTGSGDITLSAEGTPQMARIDDARGSVQARILSIVGGGEDVLAETDVRSVLEGGEGGAKGRPGMFKDDQPVNVAAKKLERTAATAVYSGDAQIWQGATSIKADTITLNEETSNLTAVGTVRTVMELEDTDDATGKTERSMTTGTAGELEFVDSDRKAVLRTNARLVSSREGDLKGKRIELFLDEGGRELQRLEAYEAVILRTDTRHGTGARLSYFAEDGRYVMAGAPVVVLEQFPNECRETTGRTLTFFRASDVISVDGNQSTRTQSKTTGTCPARPS